MVNGNFVRAVVINFVSAFIIAAVACYFLFQYGLIDVMYIGNLFGLYFLVVFGTEILIESGKLPNNPHRFIFVIVNTIIFDILFLMIIPLIFGGNVFESFDYLAMVFDGIPFTLILNAYFYMTVFAVLMLIFNYILYRAEK